jgi:hypothetical protein
MKWQAHMTPELKFVFQTLILMWTAGRKRFGFRPPLAMGLRAGVFLAIGENRGDYRREPLIPIPCASGMTIIRQGIGRGRPRMTCRLLTLGQPLR